eukprot:gb/GECH01001885.1/.p1 GENE.gb/GECH01001885.1/~~gb/GECH01001885.1/.p1  ORF type:complete len:240 (+),score=44.83 gb/GECH01001885.1/:1-720(+)
MERHQESYENDNYENRTAIEDILSDFRKELDSISSMKVHERHSSMWSPQNSSSPFRSPSDRTHLSAQEEYQNKSQERSLAPAHNIKYPRYSDPQQSYHNNKHVNYDNPQKLEVSSDLYPRNRNLPNSTDYHDNHNFEARKDSPVLERHFSNDCNKNKNNESHETNESSNRKSQKLNEQNTNQNLSEKSINDYTSLELENMRLRSDVDKLSAMMTGLNTRMESLEKNFDKLVTIVQQRLE